MKRLKTWKLFNSVESRLRVFESQLWSRSIIKDLLLDISDSDVDISISEGKDWVDVYFTSNNSFRIGECVFDLIDYMKDCGLDLRESPGDSSWFFNFSWQRYQGCPNCLSPDFEDAVIIGSVFTQCSRCGHQNTPDQFLLDKWPLSVTALKKAVDDSVEINDMLLVFSKKGLLKESLDFDSSEIKEVVGDMLKELDFLGIRNGVWVLSDKMVQVELRKRVRDKKSATVFGDRDDNRSFEWSDVSGVIDSVSEYLSEWGLRPHWVGVPKFEIRANWEGADLDELAGRDTSLFLRWVK